MERVIAPAAPRLTTRNGRRETYDAFLQWERGYVAFLDEHFPEHAAAWRAQIPA